MKNFLKEYFSFSNSERKGIIILFFVLLLLIFIWKALPYFHSKEQYSSAEFEKEITEFENSLIKNDSQKTNTFFSNSSKKLFTFDPNTISDTEWYELGFTEKQITTIRHFQEKGGTFKTKEDFKKMYCLKPDQYSMLEPYIEIKSSEKKDSFSKKKNIAQNFHEFDPNCTSRDEWRSFGLTEKQINVIENFLSKGGKFRNSEDFKKMYCIQPKLFDQLEPYISITPEVKVSKFDPDIKIDLNKTDSTELRKIKGISPYQARNIIKYRNALGGFIQKKQLLEVWGLKTDTYNNIEKNLILSDVPLRKLDLNTATFADLIKHPYLNYEITKSLMQYKKIIGKIKSVQELSANKIIPDSVILKIKPYLLLN